MRRRPSARRPLVALAVMALLGASCLVDGPTSVPDAAGPTHRAPEGPDTATDPGTGPEAPPPADLEHLRLGWELVAEGFEQPVLALPRPGTTDVWVLEQAGRVVALGTDGQRRSVAELADRVRAGGERGLLGLAFAPDHVESGRFVLHYSRAGDGATRIETWVAVPDGTAAPERVVLEVEQPAGNHNGGMVAFGPDGNLWIGLGDGGGADDRFGNGQRPDTLLGAILRLDLRGEPYAIPADNPFVGGTTPDGRPAAPEVWAYGLRNPWRFWIDPPSSQLVVADVGQDRIEEVDVVALGRGGANFGWPVREGSRCFRSGACDGEGLLDPLVEYSHDEGCSITGGVVVRGGALAALDGHFLLSDYCSGFLRSVDVVGEGLGEVRDWTEQVGALERVTSFGLDADGSPLVLTADGTIRRLVVVREAVGQGTLGPANRASGEGTGRTPVRRAVPRWRGARARPRRP